MKSRNKTNLKMDFCHSFVLLLSSLHPLSVLQKPPLEGGVPSVKPRVVLRQTDSESTLNTSEIMHLSRKPEACLSLCTEHEHPHVLFGPFVLSRAD